ncbi:hypothetical protein N7532_003458 [Penicillium argentinense]|uniref:MOSC domain-containing protein n=1 Tax=Penicillium argentinense TaxID=1131581 RepID=A0A9W9KE09_9EURO|nr:uncharacterized protein N7532_003458 [Penicillium argentinense]KAJ5102929.1 hypothetical protein N7532_003458 [Penicillium argentinense]
MKVSQRTQQLYIYPIKSLRATPVTEGTLSHLGLKYDRRFMLLKVEPKEDGSGTTLKNMHVPLFPEMALFETALELPQNEHETNGKIKVTYNPPTSLEKKDPRPRESRQLEIPLEPNVDSLARFPVTMHQSPTSGFNMGIKYNDWFSECFGYPVVLAYLGVNTRGVLGTLAPAKRKAQLESKKGSGNLIQHWFLEIIAPGPKISSPDRWLIPICFLSFIISIISYAARQLEQGAHPALVLGTSGLILAGSGLATRYYISRREDRIGFADCAPFLIISEKSVDDVSGRLASGIEMDRTKFRPNIVVSGAEMPFEEDFWTEVVIGPERVRLLLTGNCVRCQSLNVDYETGKMGTGEEGTVLKKLMKDRRVDRGAKFSPVFGRYSFLERGFEGREIRVGDSVEVVARGQERTVTDGGGVRGYSMLIILQELMYRTYVECEGKPPRRDEIPKPCDHFDLIAGTGTGGLIAIMLGRLRLDLETCKEVYVRMTRKVFETDKTIAGIPYRSTLFKASKLEEAIRECVREHTVWEAEGNDMPNNSGPRASISSLSYSPGSVPQRSVSRGSFSTSGQSYSQQQQSNQRGSTFLNGLRWGNPEALLYDNRENRTKTAVTALYKGTPRNSPAVLLRSYDSRREPPPEFDCTIWQAGRATSATGLAFKPIRIGQHNFIDEGPGTYNPAPQILEEAVVNEWPGREVGVFVSIGTGRRPSGTNNRQHEWWEDFFGDALGTFAEARRRLIAKIEGCEDIHQEMLRDILAKHNVNKDVYCRLNVEVGVGEFGMNEWNRLADISTNTRRYLSRPEVKKMILNSSVRFAKIHRMNKRLAAHAATGGDRDDMSFDLEREEISVSTHTPAYTVPPPSNQFAVELPAEPVEYFSQPPAQGSAPIPASVTVTAPPGDDSLPVHPTPHDNLPVSPTRHSIGEVASFRPSHEHIRPSSQQQNSPHHSAEQFPPFNGMPPPVPPKTPIPYPAQDGNGGDVSMPAPLFSQPPPSGGKVRPPYPVDGAPPVVNRQRKPSYHVR